MVKPVSTIVKAIGERRCEALDERLRRRSLRLPLAMRGEMPMRGFLPRSGSRGALGSVSTILSPRVVGDDRQQVLEALVSAIPIEEASA